MFTRVAALTLALATPLAFAAKDGKKDKDKDDAPSFVAPKRESKDRDRSPPPRSSGGDRESSHGSGWGRAQGNAGSSSTVPAAGSSSGNTHAASGPSWVPPKEMANGNNGGRTHGASPVGSGNSGGGSDRDDDHDHHDRDRDDHYHGDRHYDGCGHHYTSGGWVYVDDGRPYVDYGYGYDYDRGYSRPSSSGYSVYDPNRVPSTDLGVAVGFNAPAGGIGFEGEWRPVPGLGLGLHGGVGMWGTRISPVVRLYPVGVKFGLFAEGAISINEGGSSELIGAGRGLSLESTGAASLAIGFRQTHFTHFFTSVKAGYQWRFQQSESYSAGTPLSSGERFMLDMLQPGGVVVGATAGVAFW